MKLASSVQSLLNEKKENVIKLLAFAHPVVKYAAILFFCFCCYLPTINAQPIHEPIDYCKEIPRNTAALPVGTQFVDRWGYPWVQDTSGIGSRSAGLGEVQCGSFILAFADVANQTQHGFDDRQLILLPANHPLGTSSTLGELRRWTACQVFSYISQQIVISSGVTPDIYFAISDTSGSGGLAAASPFFAVPGAPAFVGGFLQQHITTGINPTPNSGDYDAKITCDFGQNGIWVVNSDTIAINSDGFVQNSGGIDLYSVLLHHATHALGFFSAIQSNGKSILTNTSPGTYSLMDKYFTDSAGTKLINSSFSFNVDTLQLIGNGLNFTDTNNTVGYPIYSPATWHGGSSLNHYDNNRDNTPFVMAPQYDFGDRRNYSKGEIEALISLNYATDKSVIGVNDTATTVVSDTITINVTENDHGVNSHPVTIVPGSMEIISGPGSANISVNNTSITYISNNQSCGGNVIIHYTPISNGKIGFVTELNIFIDCQGNNLVDPCNLVPNGDFEDNSVTPLQFENIVTKHWDRTLIYNAVWSWQNGSRDADAYLRGSKFEYFLRNVNLGSRGIPENYATLRPRPSPNYLELETNTPAPNNRYVGMYSNANHINSTTGNPDSYIETIYCKLIKTLTIGQHYKLTYDVRTVSHPSINTSNDPFVITFFTSSKPILSGTSHFAGGFDRKNSGIINRKDPAKPDINPNSKWKTVSFDIYPSVPYSYLVFDPNSSNYPTTSLKTPYVFIDNVRLEIVYDNACGPDRTICSGKSTTIGNSVVGGFSYNWSPATGLSNPNIAQPIASPTTTTTYTLEMTSIVSGCVSKCSTIVTVLPPPLPPTITPVVVCQYGPRPLLGTFVSGTDIKWYANATGGTGSSTPPVQSTSVIGIFTYYVSQTINGCESIRKKLIVEIKPCLTITGSGSVCPNSSITYSIAPVIPGLIYSWSVIAPTLGTPTPITGNSTVINWSSTTGSALITVTGRNASGAIVETATFSVTITQIPTPFITTDFRAGCDIYSSDIDVQQLFNDGSICLKVCANSRVVYTAHGLSGTVYNWTVAGGTINAAGTHHDICTVDWGNAGFGTLIVEATNATGCKGTRTVCVEIIPEPHAEFSLISEIMSTHTTCVGQDVVFFDNSTGTTSSPLVSWHWDFGDNTSYTGSNGIVPPHSYNTPGSYNIVLTVTNSCGCTSTYSFNLQIVDKANIKLLCYPHVVCEGQQVTYEIDDPGNSCIVTNWVINGGTLLSSTNRQVTVAWDNVGDDGVGYVKFYTACNQCNTPTIVRQAVIKQSGKIIGPKLICQNEPYIYKLPAWPATEYNWTLIQGGISTPLIHTDQPNETVVNITVPGTYTLHCSYRSDLANCGGTADIILIVTEKATIVGETRACQGASLNYQITNNPPGSTWEWFILRPGTTTPVSGGANLLTYNTGLLSAVGQYIISLRSNKFCPPDPIRLTVVAPPQNIITINGPTIVCPGIPYTYTATGNAAGNLIKWTRDPVANNVYYQGSQTGNTVTVVFTGAGPYNLIAQEAIGESPYCLSAPFTFTVTSENVASQLTISGPTLVCGSTHTSYSVPYTRGETYEWILTPINVGSIVYGTPANKIDITWNNATGITAQLRVRVRKCGVLFSSLVIPINVNTPPDISISAPADVCRGTAFTVTANTTSSAAVTWSFGDGGTTSSTGSASVVYTYPTLPSGGGAPTDQNITYTITASATGGGNCTASDQTTTNIVVKPSPVVSVSPLAGIVHCQSIFSDPLSAILQNGYGQTVTLAWTTPLGTAAPCSTTVASCNTITATQFGNYSVVATGINACSASSNIVAISENCDGPGGDPSGGGDGSQSCILATNIIPTIIINQNACGTIQLTGSANGTSTNPSSNPRWDYSMAANGSTTSTTNPVTIKYNVAGKYKIRFIATYQSGSATYCDKAAKVEVFIPLVADLIYTASCNTSNYNVTIFDHSNLDPSVTINGYDFYINGVQVTPINNTVNNYPTSLNPGTYIFKEVVHYNGNQTCTIDKTVILQALPNADFTFNPTYTVCAGVPIFFTNTSTNYTSNLWDFFDGSTNSLVDVEKTFTSPKNVTLTVTNAQGCSSSMTKPLVVQANGLAGKIIPTPNPATMCEGTMPLIALQYNNTNPLAVPVSYQWMNNITPVAFGTPTLNVGQTGYYWVVVKDQFLCELATAAVNVTATAIAEPIITGRKQQCDDVPFTLTSGYVENGATYQWKRNGAIVGAAPTLTEQLPQGTYNYTLTVTLNGCSRTSANFEVEVYATPHTPDITARVLDCNNYQATLSADALAVGTYNWSNGMTGDNIIVQSGGPYQVWFTDDISGCISTSSVFLPKELTSYLWTVPGGCFSRCLPPPITINGPIIKFDNWTWIELSSNGVIDNGIDYVNPLNVTSNGTYQLLLQMGRCNAFSDPLTFSLPNNCNTNALCDLLKADLVVTPEIGNCSIGLYIQLINNTGQSVSYSISSSIGGVVVPSSGSLTGSTASIHFDWAAPAGLSGIGNVFFRIRFWLPDGSWCESKIGGFDFSCDLGGRLAKANQNVQQTLSNGQLKLAPNPSQNTTVVTYLVETKKGGATKCGLEVLDMLGRSMYSTTTNTGSGRVLLNTGSWPSGIYHVVLKQNGLLYKTAKLVVSR